MTMPWSGDAVATTRLGWYHLRFDIPAHWEVIAYKRTPRDGEITLADRRGQVMRVFWKTNLRNPSPMRRLLQVAREYADKETSEATIRRRIKTVEGWQVYMPRRGDVHALASRYDEASRALLYAVFPAHPDTADAATVLRVLKSFDANAGAERVWAAFGIDITLPAELDLARVAPYPAAQLMRFENRRGESVTVYRYGMLSRLLRKDDMATFFAQRTDRSSMLSREGSYRHAGRYPGVRLSYQTRGKGGIEGFLAKTWQGRVWIWRCDELERLYAVDQNARTEHLIPKLPRRVRTQ